MVELEEELWRRWSLGEQRKQEKELSLLVASLLAAGSKEEEGEVKMKGERRRGGIYRSRIVKVMQ